MDWKLMALECELCMYYEICLRHRFYIFRSVDPMLKPFQLLRREFPPQALRTPPSFLQVLQFYHALGLKIAIIITALLFYSKFTDLGNQIDHTGNTLLTDLHEIIYPV